jgi:adenylylsulfate kinase
MTAREEAPEPHGWGFVLWITGLPSSGKSTLAEGVAARLRARGRATLVLDGDAVRARVRPSPGYDPAGRDAFYDTLAGLAALAAAQGLLVLVPATANLRSFRARARARCPEGRYAEVFVDTPADRCAARDAKGLYRGTREGAVSNVPGAGAVYEPPEAPALRVKPDDPAPDARVAAWLLAR